MPTVTAHTHCEPRQCETTVIRGNDRCSVCSGTFLNSEVTVINPGPFHDGMVSHSSCLASSFLYDNVWNCDSCKTLLLNRAINKHGGKVMDRLLLSEIRGEIPVHIPLTGPTLAIVLGDKDHLLQTMLTPLEQSNVFELAVRRNDRDMAEFLVTHNLVTRPQEVMEDNLRIAIRLKDASIVEFLFSHGASLPQQELDRVLVRAIRYYSFSMAEVLIQHGAIPLQDELKKILKTEIRVNYVPAVEFLFSHGVSLPQEELNQALSSVIRMRSLSMAKILLEQGATCPQKQLNDLLRATICFNQLPMVEFLFSQGASLSRAELIDAHGIAAFTGRPRMARLLVTEIARLAQSESEAVEALTARFEEALAIQEPLAE